MGHAVEFETTEDELHLICSPRDEAIWVQERFNRGEELIIKGTFHLTSAHLVQPDPDKSTATSFDDDYP